MFLKKLFIKRHIREIIFITDKTYRTLTDESYPYGKSVSRKHRLLLSECN